MQAIQEILNLPVSHVTLSGRDKFYPESRVCHFPENQGQSGTFPDIETQDRGLVIRTNSR